MRFREGQPSNDGFGSEANELAQAYEALSRRVAEARAEQRLFTLDGGYQMAELAFHHLLQIYQNLSVPELVEHALMRGEGGLSQEGALCVKTVPHTVRSPTNTLIVGLAPWANVSTEMPRPLSVPAFHHLYQEVQAYVQGRSLYVTEGEISPGIGVRIVTELASQALFAQQLLQPRGQSVEQSASQESTSQESRWVLCNPLEHSACPLQAVAQSSGAEPDSSLIPGLPLPGLPITLVVLPGVKGEPSLEQELPGEVFTALYPAHRLALIGGSRNCEEIRTALNYLLEQPLLSGSVLPLGPTAQVRITDVSASESISASATVSLSLVLGLDDHRRHCLDADTSSGQGFTLGTRALGWFPDQIATIAAGWYGNVALDDRPEPAHFGSLLENVILDPKTGAPNLGDRRWSEAPHIACPAPTQAWTEPVQTLILCLFDPLGIFPALARLTPEQAQYYYLCGSGNWDHADRLEESSGGSFQACFASEITIPQAIARVRCLGDRLRQCQPQIFLVNTAATWNPALGVQPLSDPQLKEQLSEAMRLGAQHCEARRSQSSTSCPYIPHLDAELLSRQVGPSPQRRAQAEALFQRFAAQIQPFKADISRSIWTAGPRL